MSVLFTAQKSKRKPTYLLLFNLNLEEIRIALTFLDIIEVYDIPEEVLDVCDNLMPFGVKIRYPQELFIEEHHARKAIQEMKQLFEWGKEKYS